MLGVGNQLNFNNLNEGSYSIYVDANDKNGCESSQEFKSVFEVWAKPEANFQMANDEVLVLSERKLLLNNYSSLTSGSLKYEWYHTKTGKSVLFSTKNNPTYKMPADTGLFNIMLVAKSNYNCADTAIENVLLVPDIIIFIPNAFTPNNDPPNNLFKLSSDHDQIFEINIYNKWGQKVFNSKSLDDSWDGTYQDQYCPNGVYLYSVKLTNKSGEPYAYQGTVNLIR
jgi:gliding motility-associated-like protein